MATVWQSTTNATLNDLTGFFDTALLAAGWVRHDAQDVNPNTWNVTYLSTGASNDIRCYIQIFRNVSAAYSREAIQIRGWQMWNNVSHVGTGVVGADGNDGATLIADGVPGTERYHVAGRVNEYEAAFFVDETAVSLGTVGLYCFGSMKMDTLPPHMSGVAITTSSHVGFGGSPTTVNVDRDISNNLWPGQTIAVIPFDDSSTSFSSGPAEVVSVTSTSVTTIGSGTQVDAPALIGMYPQPTFVGAQRRFAGSTILGDVLWNPIGFEHNQARGFSWRRRFRSFGSSVNSNWGSQQQGFFPAFHGNFKMISPTQADEILIGSSHHIAQIDKTWNHSKADPSTNTPARRYQIDGNIDPDFFWMSYWGQDMEGESFYWIIGPGALELDPETFYGQGFFAFSQEPSVQANVSITPELTVSMDINLTVHLEESLDISFADLRYVGRTLGAGFEQAQALLQVNIGGANEDGSKELAMDVSIYDYNTWNFGNPWSDPALLNEPFNSAYLDVTIQGEQPRFAELNAIIQGSAQQELDLDVLTQATSFTTAGLSVALFDSPTLNSFMDMRIDTPLLLSRLMRVRKDLTTRYFAGHPSFVADPSDDTDFPELFDPVNPTVTEIENIGSFTPNYQSLAYSTTNEKPTAGVFDKWVRPLPASIPSNRLGLRALLVFRPTIFGQNSNVMMGLFQNQNSPISDIGAGSLAAFAFETEKGHVEFRVWYGTSSSSLNIGTAVPIDYFIGKKWLLEMEVVSIGVTSVMEFRLYEMAKSLSVPVTVLTAETSVPPTVDNFAITSIGKRAPELPDSAMTMKFEYLDVELPDVPGEIFSVDPLVGIPVLDAKWRLFQQRPPIELRDEGDNQIFVALSDDGITATTEADETITVDSVDPQIIVVSFSPESSVTVPDSVNPPIIKGSLQANFDEVSMEVYATRPGVFSLRVNSTSINDGIEILSLDYPSAGVTIPIDWNFSDLSNLAEGDGIYDVTLYLLADNGKPTAKKLGEYIAPFIGFMGEPAEFD